MCSLSVVALDKAVKGGGALGVAGPGLGVGPVGEQGAVEAFGFAVGPGATGLDVAALDLQRGADRGPVVAAPVDLGVVGQDAADGDTVLGVEPAGGAVQEGGAGRGALVGVDLGVDDAAVVVDGDVDELKAALLVPTAAVVGVLSVDAPAAACRDAPELLDVDVQQVARTVVLVAISVARPRSSSPVMRSRSARCGTCQRRNTAPIVEAGSSSSAANWAGPA